ncbi:hypothetical protein BS50DRAFT_498578 [Corynespora cassiicola Philippines]|uniref:Uncharacterized protein n=1 Tax=Corynespora cassiicola Philippines TaxID=1448308 RepID=A0A2T2NFU6_CORCC|nr:hypothetical protein BS50DRAFT_498578 [Corynespora cassiicola Philippines]
MLHSPAQDRTQARGQQILDQLTLARAQHIRHVIDTYIIPLVEQQASFGIAQTTIIMIPSDIPLPPAPEKSEFSFETGNEQPVEVIGFSSESEGEPKLVRLEDQMSRSEFWRSPAIVAELQRVLKESLNENSNVRASASPHLAQHEVSQPQPRHKFIRRMAQAMGREEKSLGGKHQVETEAFEVGQVSVKARLEDLCLRTTSEFGLYDTMTKQCIVVCVDVKC